MKIDFDKRHMGRDRESTVLRLSVVIITKNEERNVARCLESVAWASEVLVLDSGSTDATVEIAQKMGARVVTDIWRGFGAQKAHAAKLAKNDWILSLDADECATPMLQLEVESEYAMLEPKTAYSFPRKSFLWGKWIRYGGWSPDTQVRLFNRQHSNWDQASIHEKVIAEKYASFKNAIEHYVFRDIADQVETNNRYSGLLATKDFLAGKKFSLLKLIFKPIFKFIENYFVKLGFLDGRAGFVIAVNSAHSTFLRWVKIGELSRLPKAESESFW